MHTNKEYLNTKKCYLFDLDGTLVDSLFFWRDYDARNVSLEEAYLEMKPRYDKIIAQKADSVDFLRRASEAGIPCYIATATRLAVCEGCIKRLGYDRYIKKAFCCDDIGAHKTSPEFYRRVQEQTGFTKDEVVIFEDSPAWAGVAYHDGFDIVGIYDAHQEDRDGMKRISKEVLHSFDEIEFYPD